MLSRTKTRAALESGLLHTLMYLGPFVVAGSLFQRGTASGVRFEVFLDSDYASRAPGREPVF